MQVPIPMAEPVETAVDSPFSGQENAWNDLPSPDTPRVALSQPNHRF
jgi:hypothetical protein